ncbi:putative replication initiation protein [Gammarus sp. amphipod associated circular virus]|uniref:Putative replication initiation protein n=1 Tax=Gammarus sp. amphipod associated circular virus TaxID=1692250 RepID=A0A0K1RLR1_9CIRC|nr:putative replication initiation protein [Gammarus sp. amphipod associated circular virus]AKV62287.1 putative replication initiation protein [Gammarus sp. amphipod associated circular virus]
MTSCRYCFTVNNPTVQDRERLDLLADSCNYLVYGNEIGSSGTPHLQGFVIFPKTKRFNAAKIAIGNTAHVECARGSSVQAATYCKKDGDFREFGELPSSQGKRTDWDIYRDWVTDLGRVPSKKELVLAFPGFYARYRKACFEYAEALTPPPILTQSEPRFGWQTRVDGIINGEANDRTIHFVVDPEGNAGKTWFCSYALTKWPDKVQVMRIGKRDDLAYAISTEKSIFLMDVPRNQMTFLQYSVLEMLKDRMIFSPKYESSFKILQYVPHVIVFSNEQPDTSALSADRINIINV